MSIHRRIIATCIVALCLAPGLQAQELSPEDQAILDQMMRSNGLDPQQIEAASKQAELLSSDVIRYSVVGVFQGRANVSSDQNWMAYADVVDRVEMQFQWKLSEGKLMGTPAMQNFKSTVSNPRNPEAKCAPPTIKGPYEHADLKSIKQGLSATIQMHLQRTYPPVDVHQFCTGALKAIPPKQTMSEYEIMVPPPTMLSMPLKPTDPVSLSADRTSLVLRKDDGWTWTFTPRGN